jgi:anti-sigma factor RsiW
MGMKQDTSQVGLRQGVRELVHQDALNDAELARLRRLADGAPSNPARRLWLGAAAGVGVAAASGFWVSALVNRTGNAQRLADEIAANHLRVAPLDVASGDLAMLREVFASLGFSLLDAAEVEDVPGNLVGGRFCSVASVPAAMLRYRTDAGVITVYQARHDARRHYGTADMDAGEPGNVRYSGGVKVCLCRSQGVLLAVASGGSVYTT